MKRQLFFTDDGSSSLRIPRWNEQYHSKHGALLEAEYVYIEKGLHFYHSNKAKKNIKVLEMGFGTGLNALLTLIYTIEHKVSVDYTGVDAFPLKPIEWQGLNYKDLLDKRLDSDRVFEALHQCAWEQKHQISSAFTLLKQKEYFENYKPQNQFDVIYFDAFGARVQPELWKEPVFSPLYKALSMGGVLVTYSAKGSVRRLMESLGFIVERLKGPPGKREMLRAIKPER